MSLLATTSNTSVKQKGKVVLHWFRHGDLRLLDNPALVYSCKLAASTKNSVILPVFCFDDKTIFGNSIKTEWSELKCGPRRAKFITESVLDLKQSIQKLTGGIPYLIVARGEPSSIFTTIIEQINESSTLDYDYTVVCQEEVVKEEKDACKAVLKAVRKVGGSKTKLHQIWGSTMYELKELPFEQHNLQDMPDVFTPFRNKVEKNCKIPRPLPVPSKNELLKLPQPDFPEYKVISSLFAAFSNVPTLEELGYTEQQIQQANFHDKRGVMEFVGGETVGMNRINDYIWTKDCLKDYFDTRNGMIGPNYSTKFSPWLAHGCISARYIASECHRYETQRVANKSTYWVIFELLWRDYCKFFAHKHGDKIFFPEGTTGKNPPNWSNNQQFIDAWKKGLTGYPLVDANMRELSATGFMSNRGRQNVASFFAIDLEQDWRIGGDYFECQLLDYDVYSNWVNWCSAAGMTGGRLNRFNIVKQSKDYDQHGDYVKHWLPELKDVPTEFVHEPWKMTQFQQMEFNVRLGVNYPKPIVPPLSGRAYDANKNDSGSNSKVPKGKERKPNRSGYNRGQKYEMKSVRAGKYDIN